MPTPLYFPHPLTANPDGLLAIGGDLSVDRLILAYRMGIFPWYSEGQPVLWWSPLKRFVINTGQLHIPRSMRKYLNSSVFQITTDQHFEYVIDRCQNIPRPGQSGTWITDEMKQAYISLHQAGLAHSVEVWSNNQITGGIYGVSAGKIFSGESMFTEVSDASKFAAIMLDRIMVKLGYRVFDCQHYSRHMELLGGYSISNKQYFQMVRENWKSPLDRRKWGNELVHVRYRRTKSSDII